MRKYIIVTVIIIIIAAAVTIWRNTAAIDVPANTGKDSVMLIDYCERTVATVGGDVYSETVLYQNRDGSCEVHYFSKYECDEEESHIYFPADEAVVKEAYSIISSSHMKKWNEKYDTSGLEGASYSLKFLTDNGEYITVTSDNMPDNGVGIMRSVENCISSFAVK